MELVQLEVFQTLETKTKSLPKIYKQRKVSWIVGKLVYEALPTVNKLQKLMDLQLIYMAYQVFIGPRSSCYRSLTVKI